MLRDRSPRHRHAFRPHLFHLALPHPVDNIRAITRRVRAVQDVAEVAAVAVAAHADGCIYIQDARPVRAAKASWVVAVGLCCHRSLLVSRYGGQNAARLVFLNSPDWSSIQGLREGAVSAHCYKTPNWTSKLWQTAISTYRYLIEKESPAPSDGRSPVGLAGNGAPMLDTPTI